MVVGLMYTDQIPIQLVNQDGTVETAIHGPNAPYPEWLFRPAGARIITGAVYLPNARSVTSGAYEASTRASVEELRREFEAAMTAAGYEVGDATLPEHALFGVNLAMSATNRALRRYLSMQVRAGWWSNDVQVVFHEFTADAAFPDFKLGKPSDSGT